MRKLLLAVFLSAALVLLGATSALAAVHAVSPAGSGSHTGADWNNALAGFPATWVRGDIYCLADGSYTSGLTVNTAVSGTSTIEVRKAQSYDATCSGLAGWNTSTMGSGQAVITGANPIATVANYVVLNGNGTQTLPGCGGAPGSTVTAQPPVITDCGIRLGDGSTLSSQGLLKMTGANDTAEYIELNAAGSNTGEEWEVFGPTGGSGPMLYSHIYGHNAGCVYMQDLGSGTTVDRSYFWGTQTNGATSCHGQAEFEIGGTNNGVRSNNVYQDISGTAVWTFAASVGTNNNWLYYNNVVFFSSPSQTFGGLSDAVLDCINGNTCTNFVFNQNSVVGCPATGIEGHQCGIGFADGASGCSLSMQNNLWYSIVSASLTQCTGMTLTEDHNSYLNSPALGSGTNDVHVASGSPNPFVNYPASNFNLASENANWNNRFALSAPYTTDVNGNTFTTDRGAYQFISGTANPPTCSPVAGTYTGTQNITLSTTSTGAIMCYTTNGTTPATNGTTGCTTGTLYSSAVSIASSLTLESIAGGTGFADSSVTSCAYVINPVTTPTALQGIIAGNFTMSGNQHLGGK